MDEWEQVIAALKILGLSEIVTFSQIKSAYRQMAKQFHPDQVSNQRADRGADRAFKQATLAYHILERFWEHLPIPMHPEKLAEFLRPPAEKRTRWFHSFLGGAG